MNRSFEEQLSRHPAMQGQDLIKFCYQAVFGAEHLLANPEQARAWFDREYEATPETEEPLWERIGRNYARVNLGAWKKKKLDPDVLFDLFVRTANRRTGSREEFSALAAQCLDSRRKAVRPMRAVVEAYLQSCEEKGPVPVHHSEIYRAHEKPAYRVIALSLLQEVVTERENSIASEGRIKKLKRYQKFEPLKNAALSLNYLTSMVDENEDNLPYWLILPNKKPAEAAHCRVDDAELVGSWYEGLDSVREMLQTEEGGDVLQSFRRFLLSDWGEHGLRFHHAYPWTHTMHSSFHEMGYILPALNRLSRKEPDNEEIESRISGLIRGMRSLVIERKVRTFWSGDSVEKEPVYEFPNDVYLQDGGFDLTRHTGRGEQSIRNSIMLPALVERYELKHDEVALDLAKGLANYLLGPSRYFNYKQEFFGHVHSAGWTAIGLARLARVTGDEKYLKAAKNIYTYIRSLSSSFGWVPEYAQWHPMNEEHCETCCIRDMILCAWELIRAGYPEYWNDINLFARNQLVENQVTSATYVTVDNSLPDGNGITYRDIDKRMLGGFTGGSLPNSISLSKFRSIAGCCVGLAPTALKLVWDIAVTKENSAYVVNIPLDKETDAYTLKMEYPEHGRMEITLKQEGAVAFRRYPWMGKKLRVLKNGVEVPFEEENSLILIPDIKAGETVALTHPLRTVTRKEIAAGTVWQVVWRGCDVIDLLPHGEHLRLYQRDMTKPAYLPKPEDVPYLGAVNYGPTQQKK